MVAMATMALVAATPVPMAMPPAAKPMAMKPVGTLLDGNWAGNDFALGADDDRITLQSGCSHGRSAGPVHLDKSGNFSVPGYFNPPHTGFRLGDIAPRDRPAVFSGNVRGNKLLLSVAFTGADRRQHLLMRDAHIAFPACKQ